MTVDWAHDRDRYLYLRRFEKHAAMGEGRCYGSTMNALSACQGWLVSLLVGLSTGLIAAFINLTTHWTLDMRKGYCAQGWWLGYTFCCVTDTDIYDSAGPCAEWVTWFDALGGSGSPYWVNYGMFVVCALAMAALAAYLVTRLAPYARGAGIAEIKTILNGVVIKGYLGAYTMLIKVLALVLAVGAGLAIGKEGPFVHLGCAVANIVSRWFPKYRDNQAKKNEMISAGAAAGVAVGFGAPVGGVLFSLEEISTYFPNKTMWRAFFAAAVAALTLQYLDPLQTGKLVLFEVNYDVNWHFLEMLPFLFIGVAGGLMGHLFIRGTLAVVRARRASRVAQWPVLEIAVLAVCTTLITYHTDFLKGSINNVLALLFDECSPYEDPLKICDNDSASRAIVNLLAASLLMFSLTVVTFGTAVPSGLFIPSLLIGATMGRMVGTAVRLLQQTHQDWAIFSFCAGEEETCITPGIYAIVGAAAVLSGVTRMTVSLVVIMFELTGGLEYLLPIIVVIMVSKWVADAFDAASIYEQHIRLNEYPFLEDVDQIDLDTLASDVMSKELLVLTMHGHTVDNLRQQAATLAQLKMSGVPVVTNTQDMLVVGYITRQELEAALNHHCRRPDVTGQTRCYFAMVDMRFPRNAPYVDLRPWLHPTPIQVTESTPLHRIYNIFKSLGLRYCLVTQFGRLVGIITKKDILHYFHELHKKAALGRGH